jgi:hypothetical protein
VVVGPVDRVAEVDEGEGEEEGGEYQGGHYQLERC